MDAYGLVYNMTNGHLRGLGAVMLLCAPGKGTCISGGCQAPEVEEVDARSRDGAQADGLWCEGLWTSSPLAEVEPGSEKRSVVGREGVAMFTLSPVCLFTYHSCFCLQPHWFQPWVQDCHLSVFSWSPALSLRIGHLMHPKFIGYEVF